MKRTIKILTSFTVLFLIVCAYGVAFADSAPVQLQELTPALEKSVRVQGLAEDYGLVALAAGLGIAIAAFGGALGQGRTAAVALEGIARNPSAAGQIRGPMILGLALIESLVIYAFVITLLLMLKVGA